MKLLAIGAALGAAIAYFFDSQNGKRRRDMTRDRIVATARGTARRAERTGRGVAASAYGASQKVQHLQEEPKDLDDVTLARKVETELFRPADAPKGDIDVNVEHGVVVLRGEAQSPEMIDELVSRARDVQGVREVENLLHLPGTPAPMHQ
jgi:osmotically-inducible protein OsmY